MRISSLEETVTIGTDPTRNPDFLLHSRPTSTTGVIIMSGMREEDASEKEGMIGMLLQAETWKEHCRGPDLLPGMDISITILLIIKEQTPIRKR